MAVDKHADHPKRGDVLTRLLFVLGSLCLVAALAIVGVLVWQYVDAQKRAAEVSNAASMAAVMDSDAVKQDFGIDDLNVDWPKLHTINPDIIAWIVVPGTNINYAVAQGSDNDYYLRKSYDGGYSISGSIFMDHSSNRDMQGRNTIIYGHDMNDGTMFSQLVKYKDKNYFDKHKYIYIATPKTNYKLEAISTILVHETNPLRQFDFVTDQDFADYLGKLFDLSVLLPNDPRKDGSIDTMSRIIQLVTCDAGSNDYRVILMTKPVDSKVVKR